MNKQTEVNKVDNDSYQTCRNRWLWYRNKIRSSSFRIIHSKIYKRWSTSMGISHGEFLMVLVVYENQKVLNWDEDTRWNNNYCSSWVIKFVLQKLVMLLLAEYHRLFQLYSFYLRCFRYDFMQWRKIFFIISLGWLTVFCHRLCHFPSFPFFLQIFCLICSQNTG